MTAERIVVTNARGESFADIARRLGSIAGVEIPSNATDAEVLASFQEQFAEVVAAAGYSVISSVRVTTSASIAHSGLPIIDGIQTVAGDRILDKNNSDATLRGIWVAAAGAWARAIDFDDASEIVTGAYVVVTEGSQAGAWVLATQGAITVGVTGLSFRVFRYSSLSRIQFRQTGSTVARSAEAKMLEMAVSIVDFRLATDVYDTDAFQRALAAGFRRIYFPAGKGLGAGGVYLIYTQSTVTGNVAKVGYLTAGVHLFGDGIGRTVIRPADPDETIFRALSTGASDTVDDIRISDMTLYGYSDTEGFSEHVHLVALMGVRRAIIERVQFKASRGDGLLLSYGEVFGEERHNYDCTVRSCHFDGVNRANRNAISIIDGNGMLVEDVTIENYTDASMPGPMDIEPDGVAHYVGRSITLRRITLRNNGGNLGEICIFYPSAVPPPFGVACEDIASTGYLGTGAVYCISINRALAASDAGMAVVFRRTNAKNGNSPFFFYSGKGISLDESNVFEDFDNTAIAGGGGASDLLWDSSIRPTLRNCGTGVASGVLVGKANNVEFGGRWYKCGQNTAGGYPLQFTAGSSSRITILRLDVTKGTSQTIAISNDGHTFSSATNFERDNYLDGLTSQFVATAPGQVLTGSITYDPASLADTAGGSPAVTVTGAAPGDYASASFSNDLQGITLTAYVSAANTVTVRFQNESGATVDLASGTLRARVVKA